MSIVAKYKLTAIFLLDVMISVLVILGSVAVSSLNQINQNKIL